MTQSTAVVTVNRCRTVNVIMLMMYRRSTDCDRRTSTIVGTAGPRSNSLLPAADDPRRAQRDVCRDSASPHAALLPLQPDGPHAATGTRASC